MPRASDQSAQDDAWRRLLNARGVADVVLNTALGKRTDHGGALDTALLEQGVPEPVILSAMGELFQLPTVGDEVTQIDEAAMALFPERLADRHALLPVRAAGRKLFVASAREHDRALLDEISFMLSLYVKPVMTTELRFAHGMWLRYGTQPSDRVAGVLRQFVGEIPETRFEEIVLEELEPIADVEPVSIPVVEITVDDVVDEVDEARRSERVRWTVDDAIAEIALAPGRDGMIETLLRFAHRRLDTVIVFVARTTDKPGGVRFQAWDGIDPDKGRGAVRAIRIEDAGHHALTQVADTRAPYLGPLGDDDPIVKALGRAPRAATLVPVIIGDHLAGVVYGDCGKRSVPPASVAELHMVVPRFATALRNLIFRKRNADEKQLAAAVSSKLNSPQLDDQVEFVASSAGSFVASEAEAGEDLPIEVDASAFEALAAQQAPAFDPVELESITTLPPLSPAPAPSPGAGAREVLLTATWRAWRTHDDAAGDQAVARLHQSSRTDRATLASHGVRLMPALSRAFPGTPQVRLFAAGLSATNLIQDTAAISEVVELLMRLGPDLAAPIVTSELEHDDRAHRAVASCLMSAMRVPGALQRLAGRIFDPELRVAHLAVLALERYRDGSGFERLLETMRRTARFHREPFRQRRAIVALTELRDIQAMPHFIQLLGTEPREVAEEAHRSLVDLSKQDFGHLTRRWGAWLADHLEESRVKWLIDALGHRERRLRLAAQHELNALTQQNFGYHADAPLKARETALGHWRAWYEREGRFGA